MQTSPILHGVPASLQHDAWWLAAGLPDPSVPPIRTSPGASARDGFPRLAPAILLLVLLADLLFWERELGLSLALFAAAILAVALVLGPTTRRLGPALTVAALGLLPAIELVQPLSVLLLAGALAVSLVLARGFQTDALFPAALRLIARAPFAGAFAALSALPNLGMVGTAVGVRRTLAVWAVPVGGTLVFATLLVDANPVLARLFELDLDMPRLILRALFWIGIALLVVPLLTPQPEAAPLTLPSRLPVPGVNAASTERALWMFNALIGVQTLMDLSIFVGGAALPEGMTYAEYAHRGAYPLLATALLAGAFAFAANPFLAERRGLRPLMLLWLAQNVALCLSALLRLDLYVQAYGLTYLRIHAAIWMGLVAAGLALTAWQVWTARPNRWLLPRVAVLGGTVLYLSAFVNFAALIADYNLSRGFDRAYVCELPAEAAAVIAAARRADPSQGPWCARAPVVEGWRDWGFRKWRVRRYLAMAQPEPGS